MNFLFAQGIQFNKETIKINNIPILVEIADTDAKQQLGLMFRRELKDGEGMLFVFKNEQPRTFWMKNTFIDLSIAFANKNKIIISILDMQATKPEGQTYYPQYHSEGPAKYALEVPKGWFAKHKIRVGDKLVLK